MRVWASYLRDISLRRLATLRGENGHSSRRAVCALTLAALALTFTAGHTLAEVKVVGFAARI